MPAVPAAQDSRFRAYVSQYAKLADDDWQQTIARWARREVPARRVLVRPGQVCGHLYFLESGYLRYFVPHRGRFQTKYFTWPWQICTASASFSGATAASEGIQTLSAAVLWRISFDDLQVLYAEVPAWHVVIRKVLQGVQLATEEVLLAQRNRTASERYEELLREDAALVGLVSVQDMASYLGIAPESLSRIRAQFRASTEA
jgi:CRP-like cAMP-binding protein